MGGFIYYNLTNKIDGHTITNLTRKECLTFLNWYKNLRKSRGENYDLRIISSGLCYEVQIGEQIYVMEVAK